jgi:hypothetical protein
MNETRAVKDLSIGDHIQVKEFDDPLVVRSAKKVQKGTDAGKLDVKLTGPDGNVETVRFHPEEVVAVVGKAVDRGQTTKKPSGKNKGKAKGPAGQQKAPRARAGPKRLKRRRRKTPALRSQRPRRPSPRRR